MYYFNTFQKLSLSGLVCMLLICSGLCWAEWQYEIVDYSTWFTNQIDLEVDSDGNPHIVFAGNFIYYARVVDGTWVQEEVDFNYGSDGLVNLALDADGNPHVVYNCVFTNDLIYAYKEGDQWIREYVDGADSHLNPLLALDSQGNPYICYFSLDNYSVRYAYREGGIWQNDKVSMGGYCDTYDFVVEADGTPHLLYESSGAETTLKYAVKTDDQWYKEDLITVPSIGATKLFWGVDGALHAIYGDNYGMTHIYRSDTGWQEVETIQIPMFYISVFYDEEGILHILGRHAVATYMWELLHLYNDNEWRDEIVFSPTEQQQNLTSSFFFDTNNVIHCAAICTYMSLLNNTELLYGSNQTGAWEIEVLENAHYTGASGRMNVDAEGTVDVVYSDPSYPCYLRFASMVDSVWQTELIEELDLDRSHFAIAKTPDATVHVVYLRETAPYDVVYLYRNGSGWSSSTIDTASIAEEHRSIPSLAVDSEGNLYCSYSLPDQGLYVAKKTGSNWSKDLVEAGAAVGIGSSLAFDTDDNFHLAYRDYDRLMYANKTNGTWHIETIDSGILYDNKVSLQLNTSQQPVVTYLKNNGRYFNLQYAFRLNETWHRQFIDYAHADHMAKCALDENGYLHLIYLDTEDNLFYTRQTDDAWEFERLNPENLLYYNADFVRSANGDLRMIFCSYELKGLMYGFQVAASPTPTPPPQTPTPTPTAYPATGVTISMPAHRFIPGDTCSCTATICNATGVPLSGYPVFIVLDLWGVYFFGPGFTNDLDNYLETLPVIPEGTSTLEVIQPFMWPSGVGSASDVTFLGAITDPDVTTLIGDMGSFTFGWGE